MKVIYENNNCIVKAGLLEEFKNNEDSEKCKKIYESIKQEDGLCDGLCPLIVELYKDSDKGSCLLHMFSFIDSEFKFFTVQEPIIISIDCSLTLQELSSKKIEEHIVTLLIHLDLNEIIMKLFHLNEQSKKYKKYTLLVFSNVDYAAQAASYIKEISYSCLYKENNCYNLIISFNGKKAEDIDLFMAQSTEYCCCPSSVLSEMQLQATLEQANEILFEQNAIEKLNQYTAFC